MHPHFPWHEAEFLKKCSIKTPIPTPYHPLPSNKLLGQ